MYRTQKNVDMPLHLFYTLCSLHCVQYMQQTLGMVTLAMALDVQKL
jgi:hypothetical protein